MAVAGACSRAGKTALAATLLRALPADSAVALKFTTTDDVFERCPRGSPCVVCDIDVPFRIVEDPSVLRQPGTDTDRLAAAGAARVIWTITRRHAAPAAWQAVATRISAAPHVVIEGSTVVDLVAPDLLIFVVHPFLLPARWKPTSAALLARADAVIVNRPAGEERDPAPEVMHAIELHGATHRVRIADVTQPLGEWAPDLLRRVE
jgi:hypothetical protein